ncbi:MAG: hypothetical protein H6737_04550 [Alphaproteobacteria bacterium]|nr:hypothetical protein [Alphaproteobacteria bacterium]
MEQVRQRQSLANGRSPVDPTEIPEALVGRVWVDEQGLWLDDCGHRSAWQPALGAVVAVPAILLALVLGSVAVTAIAFGQPLVAMVPLFGALVSVAVGFAGTHWVVARMLRPVPAVAGPHGLRIDSLGAPPILKPEHVEVVREPGRTEVWVVGERRQRVFSERLEDPAEGPGSWLGDAIARHLGVELRTVESEAPAVHTRAWSVPDADSPEAIAFHRRYLENLDRWRSYHEVAPDEPHGVLWEATGFRLRSITLRGSRLWDGYAEIDLSDLRDVRPHFEVGNDLARSRFAMLRVRTSTYAIEIARQPLSEATAGEVAWLAERVAEHASKAQPHGGHADVPEALDALVGKAR